MQYVSLYEDRHISGRSCYNLSAASGGVGHSTLRLRYFIFFLLFGFFARRAKKRTTDEMGSTICK